MSLGPINEAQGERFRRLAWPMMDVVLRTAQCLTHRTDEAEDLAQDAMVKAMRAIDSYQDGTDIKAWLLTILRRTHIDRIRATRHQPRSVSMEERDWEDKSAGAAGEHDLQWHEPEDLMNRLEDDAVINAMKKLPEDFRWALLLIDVEQMDQAEAAAVLEIPIGTIKSRTSRGRAMLRDRLYEIAHNRGLIRESRRASG